MDKQDCKSISSDNKCPVCNSSNVSKCSGCNKVAYCSRACQKTHWKVHKKVCQAWKILESPRIGRCLAAVRDIRPGELILKETPLLLTPPNVTAPLCLSCFTEFPDPSCLVEESPSTQLKPKHCFKKCGWPRCNSANCQTSEIHGNGECKYAKARGGISIKNFGNDHPLYRAIGVLRALGTKQTNPEMYQKFLTLQSHHKPGLNPTEEQLVVEQEEKQKNDVLVKLLTDFFEVKEATEEEIRQILGIIQINGHEIPLPVDPEGNIRRAIGIYHNSSFMEHNCRPNCVKSWNTSTYEIQIRSCVAIKKGDPLSISYVDQLYGSNDRINFLQLSKFFTCKCARCCDPTELGSHISSLRCQQIHCSNLSKAMQNNVGLICPEDPFNPESEWKCNNCSESYAASFVTSILGKVSRELETLDDKHGDIKALEEFLKKFSHMLGPNHFYLLEVKLELAQLYGRMQDEPLPFLPPEKLLRKKQLCEELLKVVNIISPGLTRLRSLVLYELQASIMTLSKLGQVRGELSPDVHRTQLEQCIEWMKEIVLVLNWEPENSVEQRRAVGARSELQDLQEMLAANEA